MDREDAYHEAGSRQTQTPRRSGDGGAIHCVDAVPKHRGKPPMEVAQEGELLLDQGLRRNRREEVAQCLGGEGMRTGARVEPLGNLAGVEAQQTQDKRRAEEHPLDVGQVVEAEEGKVEEGHAKEKGRDTPSGSRVGETTELVQDLVAVEKRGEVVEKRVGSREDRIAFTSPQRGNDRLTVLLEDHPLVTLCCRKHG